MSNSMHCRNKILNLWSSDVTRILPLAECGASCTRSESESPRSSLIREVYAFLDQYVSLFTMLFGHQYSFPLLFIGFINLECISFQKKHTSVYFLVQLEI